MGCWCTVRRTPKFAGQCGSAAHNSEAYNIRITCIIGKVSRPFHGFLTVTQLRSACNVRGQCNRFLWFTGVTFREKGAENFIGRPAGHDDQALEGPGT